MLFKTHTRITLAIASYAVLAAAQALAVQAGQAWPRFGSIEDLGAPLGSTQVIHGIVTEEGGVSVAAVTVSGDPAKFNVFDLENDKVLRSFDIPKGKTFWIHGADSAGDVFFAGYVSATLYQYSVKTGTVREVGPLFGEQAACAIAFDDEDNVYIGTYPRAKIIKYDRKSDKLVDLGSKIPDEKYFKSLVYHDGYLYGGGMKASADFVRVNLETLETEQLPKPADGKVSSYYYASKARDLLFMNATIDGAQSLLVYDLKDGKWLDLEYGDYRGLAPSPEIDGKVYFAGDGNMWEFDLESRKATRMGLKYGTGLRGGGVATLQKDSRFAEPSFVNFFYGGSIGIYNFKTGVSKTYSSDLAPAEGVVSELAFSGNDLLVGEFMGTRMMVLDPQGQKKPLQIPLGQAESAAVRDGKVYFGIYPAASVDVYDPAQPPAAKKNPNQLFSLKNQGQSRPFGLTFTDTKMVVGMTADYGLTEGALAVYDLASGSLQTYKNILPDQNYTSLDAKDNIVWGGTSIFGGLGSAPVAKAGLLFSFDPQSGKIIKAVEPVVDGINTPIKAWGGVKIGPDGLLWTVSYGMVAAFDPQTFDLVKKVEVVPTNWANAGMSWARNSLAFTKDGFVVTNPSSTLVIINPADMQWKRLLPASEDRRVSQSVIAPNGDIYFRSESNSSRVFRIELEPGKQESK